GWQPGCDGAGAAQPESSVPDRDHRFADGICNHRGDDVAAGDENNFGLDRGEDVAEEEIARRSLHQVLPPRAGDGLEAAHKPALDGSAQHAEVALVAVARVT